MTHHMLIAGAALLSTLIGLVVGSTIVRGTTTKDCSCGFRNVHNGQVFTDSVVVYFNETDSIPTEGFLVESYENQYEKGWNTLYRQGASPNNVNIANASSTSGVPLSQSLELYCDAATDHHLVVGGSVRTARQDIFFGSFRTLMRSTQPWSGGSALSMTVSYNETESIEMSQINSDDPANAWFSMISHGQFPSRDLGVNYTQVAGNGTDPWNWIELRVDWSRDEISYYIGGKLYRSVSRSQDPQLPQTPSAIYLKHWSVGNHFSTQGPPSSRSLGNVGLVRLFFNSSLMNDEGHAEFDTRCQTLDACDVDDLTLRGVSSYSLNAMSRWSQEQPQRHTLIIPLTISIISISVTAFLLINASLLRLPWKRFKFLQRIKEKHVEHDARFPSGTDSRDSRVESFASKSTFSKTTSISSTSSSSAVNSPLTSSSASSSIPASRRPSSEIRRLDPPPRYTSTEDITNEKPRHSSTTFVKEDWKGGKILQGNKTESTIFINEVPVEHSAADIERSKPPESAPHAERKAEFKTDSPLVKKRVDYLAGLVALSCLLVTAVHFNLTFASAAIDPTTYVHYPSEVWARRIITPFLLNLNWIGPFLMTSTRFLVSTFLRTGNLRGVAEKTVQRPFRLLIPVTLIAALEYFLLDSGAINWLEYLPSVTWSSWPFATVPDTFGHFVNKILELAYLIPNASPQIIFNYCTGVLWTIPVQLQGSWVTLLGAIMIYEIKTPWKRLCFYAWCTVVHWYALSWGTYFYLGILLTDLDITFHWKEWLYSHCHIYYPFIFACALIAIGSLGIDLLGQWTNVNYPAYEYGWHPDAETGLPIAQTPNAGYPQYFVPKLNGLIFSVFFQAVVELSPWVQKVFSFQMLVYVFPHIFTIYLIHGFVFWSLGSMICVFLARRGLPYWANISVVAVCSYAAIVMMLPFLTPVVETLGKNLTKGVWEDASEEPAHRKPTMYPFGRELLEGRQGIQDSIEVLADKDVEKGEASKEMGPSITNIGADSCH
jgi:hypothetical protein